MVHVNTQVVAPAHFLWLQHSSLAVFLWCICCMCFTSFLWLFGLLQRVYTFASHLPLSATIQTRYRTGQSTRQAKQSHLYWKIVFKHSMIMENWMTEEDHTIKEWKWNQIILMLTKAMAGLLMSTVQSHTIFLMQYIKNKFLNTATHHLHTIELNNVMDLDNDKCNDTFLRQHSVKLSFIVSITNAQPFIATSSDCCSTTTGNASTISVSCYHSNQYVGSN